MSRQVVGIVGSYHRGGIVDSLVDEVLNSAAERGAETKRIFLADKRVEFCTNCRSCARENGIRRGRCIHDDDMAGILDQCEAADVLVLGAPVNFYNVNALTRCFMERLICYSSWPADQLAPRLRVEEPDKKAVLVTAAALPAPAGYVLTGAPRALKKTALSLGAKPQYTLFEGMAANREHPSWLARTRARSIGRRIAVG